MRPEIAAMAADSGLMRKTRASAVPERPSKLRFEVRSETEPLAGDCPLPMQKPQEGSTRRAPAAMSISR